MSWRRSRSRSAYRSTSDSSSGTSSLPPPELEVGVDPLLERVQPELLEPAYLALGRSARTPRSASGGPRQSASASAVCPTARRGGPGLRDQPLEADGVHLVRPDLEHVAGPA